MLVVAENIGLGDRIQLQERQTALWILIKLTAHINRLKLVIHYI